MFEQLGFESLSPLLASALFGVLLGMVFGVAAQRSRFCLRRALADANASERSDALAVWLAALGIAIAGTQLSIYLGWIDFTGHRFHAAAVPVISIVLGGILFGIGMILTRGCASRLTVLAGSGNLRALFVLLVFAVTAHATLKGLLTPIRTSLSSFTIAADSVLQITSSPFTTPIVAVASTAFVIALFIKRPGIRRHLFSGVVIGLLVVFGWVGTGLVLQDDFDPIAFQSLSFTSSSTEWLFWSIASTSIGAGFGVGLFSGVLLGSAVSSLIRSEFQWVSFESPSQTGRYLTGAALMGVGGVLAGGCTVGAGLSGISSLSLSAMLALGSIAIGAITTNSLSGRKATYNQQGGGTSLNAITQ
ncbi:MAG: YeeE/YedE family protein [Granulosicoccus sp.]